MCIGHLCTRSHDFVCPPQLGEARKKADAAMAKLAESEIVINSLTEENKDLKAQALEAEAYSKKMNLIFYNIPDKPKETLSELRGKLEQVFRYMDIDLNRIYINNTHRLPSSDPDRPRPVIVKFVSYLDRERVWNHREQLRGKPWNVFVREHYPKEMEENIKLLLPIRREAITQVGKLYRINSSKH